MRQLATDSRNNKGQRSTTRPRPGQPVRLGKDGRLTVLLIGSDWRPDAGGERLDVLMVATIDPKTGDAAVVSIPRDMSGIPLHDGGTSGGMRVNSIYYMRYRDANLPHPALDRGGLKRFSKDIGALLGTEIDYWALTRFGTFANLINTLGGVHVDVDQEVLDTYYHHGNTRGIWFPVQDDYLLKGDPHCGPKPKKCHSALVYARSRHGMMGSGYNSDYRRAERQQDIVRSRRQGRSSTTAAPAWPCWARCLRVRDLVETNIPKTAEAAGQLFALRGEAQAAGDGHEGAGPLDVGRHPAATAPSSPTCASSATGWTRTSTRYARSATRAEPGGPFPVPFSTRSRPVRPEPRGSRRGLRCAILAA